MSTSQKEADAHVALRIQLSECGMSDGPVMPLEGMKMLGRELDKISKNREEKDADFAQHLHLQLNGGGASGGRGGAVCGGRGGRGGTNRVGIGADRGAGIGRADAMTDRQLESWLAEGGSGASDACGGHGGTGRVGSNAGYGDSAGHVILFTRCSSGICITSVPSKSWWRKLQPMTIVTHIGGIDVSNQRITDATIRDLLQKHWQVIIVGGHTRIAEFD
jgi:hypothetical protein